MAIATKTMAIATEDMDTATVDTDTAMEAMVIVTEGTVKKSPRLKNVNAFEEGCMIIGMMMTMNLQGLFPLSALP